jgi:hypothetical protein
MAIRTLADLRKAIGGHSNVAPILRDVTDTLADMAQATAEAAVAAALPYKVYTALLNQSGTAAPVATVLQNTLESIPVWTRSSAGSYYAALPDSASFTVRACAIIGSVSSFNGITGRGDAALVVNDESELQPIILAVKTFDISQTGDIVSSDNILVDTLVEIRVYP